MALLLYVLGVMLVSIIQVEFMFDDDYKNVVAWSLVWPALPLVWLAFVAYERWFDA